MDGQQQSGVAITVLPIGSRNGVAGDRSPHVDPRPLAASAVLAGACCAAASPFVDVSQTAATLAAGGAIWAAAIGLFGWALARIAPAPRFSVALAGAWAMLAAGASLDMPSGSAPVALVVGALLGQVYDVVAARLPARASALILPFPPRPQAG